MLKITILTPTYNRAHLLHKLYHSLLIQNYRNIEWVVVDDGSVDNTQNVVEQFIAENCIDIKYVYKKNGGKPSAHNEGVKQAESDLTVICDDDDYFTEDAISLICDYWKKYSKKETTGMIGYRENTTDLNNKEHVFPSKVYSYVSEIFSEKIFDTVQIYRTDLLKKNLFPITDGEKFVPEIWLWKKLDMYGKLIIVPHVLEIIEYRDDGMTKTGSQTPWNNPVGYSYYFEQKYKESKGLSKVKYYGVYKGLRKKTNRDYEGNILLDLISIPICIFTYLKCKKIEESSK